MPHEIARIFSPRSSSLPRLFLLTAAFYLLWAVRLNAQQPVVPSVQQPGNEAIARTSATSIHVTGAVELNHGEMLLGNGSTVTAETEPAKIALTRGGTLRLCSTTGLHLAEDRSTAGPSGAALMMALDRGAIETDYSVGKYSDVLLTPDLRIVISGPGQAELSVRVNSQGDTCVDNHGSNAPYVTVTSQFNGGLYRVQPNQRVTFEHGSLEEVVDRETESCGCPAAPLEPVETAGVPAKHPGQSAAGPASPSADTSFPVAVSAGLAPTPAPASTPVVPAGQAHAEVTVPFTYNGDHPPGTPVAAAAVSAPVMDATTSGPGPAAVRPASLAPASLAPASLAPASPGPAFLGPGRPGPGDRFFHRIGRFFSRIFRG